jgi:hypothetical protein
MVENALVRSEFEYFSPNTFPYSVLLLLVSHLIFDLSASWFLLCPHELLLSLAYWTAHFVGQLAHLVALPSAAYAT